jgi:hypothetical protein
MSEWRYWIILLGIVLVGLSVIPIIDALKAIGAGDLLDYVAYYAVVIGGAFVALVLLIMFASIFLVFSERQD